MLNGRWISKSGDQDDRNQDEIGRCLLPSYSRMSTARGLLASTISPLLDERHPLMIDASMDFLPRARAPEAGSHLLWLVAVGME